MSDKECTSCNQNKLSNIHKGMLIVSIYVVVSSIYGTVKLYSLVSELILNYFK
jgi:hypothetical protein